MHSYIDLVAFASASPPIGPKAEAADIYSEPDLTGRSSAPIDLPAYRASIGDKAASDGQRRPPGLWERAGWHIAMFRRGVETERCEYAGNILRYEKGNPAARRARKADGPLRGGRAAERGERMHRYISLLTIVSITVLLGFGAPTVKAQSEPNSDNGMKPGLAKTDFAPGRILVKIKDEAPVDAIESVNRKNQAHLDEKIPGHRVSVVDLPESLPVAEAIERYEASPEVEYAEPDYQINPAALAPKPNDPGFPKMYDLYNTGQYNGTFDADMDAPEAWRVTKGNSNVVVAVLDTGMDINHRDLNDNIWTNPDEIPDNGRDDDKNGYVDDVHGWDFRNEDNSVFDGATQDTHGTIVASTIAAEGNNSIGVTGLNWHVQVAPLKFIGADGVAYTSDAIEALEYAVDEGIKISNNSWGGNGTYSQVLYDAIERASAAGHLFVASAGNGGADLVGDNNDAKPFYPASYDVSNIISVAATNHIDTLTSFSNHGANSVDLGAPGINIPCAVPGNAYSQCWGTSMAAPHVTGVAALVKSQFPALNGEGIKARILTSVDKKASLSGRVASGGRVNAARAVGANTAPVILNLSPVSRVSTSKALIGATVRDLETQLGSGNIQLYFDGLRKTFLYDRVTDRLIYRTGALAARRHYVKIVASDGQGLQEIRSWSFEVRY